MIRVYLVRAEFDDAQFGPDRQHEIELLPQSAREEKIRETLQRDVPNLEITAVTEIINVDVSF